VVALNLEREALESFNYLENLVDPATGYTYFDVFLTDPAEAVHDWPDFLDVPSRSAETCVLLRHMTGRQVATEDAFFGRIYALQERDGLFWRPETEVTRHEVQLVESALIMAALLARAIGDSDTEAEGRLKRLVDALAGVDMSANPFDLMLHRPMARAYEAFGWPAARSYLERALKALADGKSPFRPDGSFAGHVHSQLYLAAGLVEAGRLLEDEHAIDFMERVFLVIRERSTRFGFVPELAERDDDVIGCETCCLMDYIHLALALGRVGKGDCYDDAELAVRNHLVESRVRHGDWLPERRDARDEGLVLREGLQQKVIGAYAGWSSPNHILAYDEFLPAGWIKDEGLAPVFLRKVRALQNCCGPSGPKALYLAWQHAARVERDTVRVNLLLDRALPEAEVRCLEPHEGRVEVTVAKRLRVALRVPGFSRMGDVAATCLGRQLSLREEGCYVVTEPLEASSTAVFRYPLAEADETVIIGNEGFQQYIYTVRWRGSTVLSIEPADNAREGRSHLVDRPVRLYYGADGPHPLYRRQGTLSEKPSPEPLNRTPGPGVW